MALVISGFPGIGKSYLVEGKDKEDYEWFYKLYGRYPNIVDLDSSSFSKNKYGERSPLFPTNYIDRILELYFSVDIILVSSHLEVRKALQSRGIAYFAVCPELEDDTKEIYLKRYKDRGSPQAFIDLMEENFEDFVNGIGEHNGDFEANVYGEDTLYDSLQLLWVTFIYKKHRLLEVLYTFPDLESIKELQEVLKDK